MLTCISIILLSAAVFLSYSSLYHEIEMLKTKVNILQLLATQQQLEKFNTGGGENNES